MNKLKYTLLAIILTFSFLNAQDKKIKKAKESFNRFEFSKAIKLYEGLVKEGVNSSEIYKNLGDANYLIANYNDASNWYTKLYETDTNALDIEHMYRYANSLRSIQKYNASDRVLKRIYALKNPTIDVSNFSNEKYMNEIKERYGSYSINNLDVNTAQSDFAPSFRLDGIVFSSGRDTSGISKTVHNWNQKRFLNLYTATNTEETGFKNAMLFSDELNTKLHESSTAFTKDGKTVYFTRNKENGKSFGRDAKGISRLKLYKAIFEDGKWKKIKELPFNKKGFSVAHPTLNKAEDKLYFASDIEGTFGQSDIFVVDINADGSFGKPKNLGDKINTGGRETFPFVTKDDILYFASDGHPGLGGLDVFAVDLKTIETSKIVNLAEPINSSLDDFSFIINTETKKGYFSSNRANGKGDDDIYALTEIKPMDTRCFSLITGIVKEKTTGTPLANVNISILDKDEKKLATGISKDNGTFEIKSKCSTNELIAIASKDSYEEDKKIVAATIIENSTNITLQITRINTGAPIQSDLSKYLQIEPIYFDLNKWDIRPEAKKSLEKIIAYLKEFPKDLVQIKSHTDSRASRAYNIRLSNKRANKTMEYLIENGINANRLSAIGLGETQLTNDCDDTKRCLEKEHQQNRRSEFIVTNK